MDDKAVKKSISFPPALLEQAAGRAKTEYGDNLSRYIQTALERDLSGAVSIPAASDPKFLEHLIAAVLPSRVARFRRLWEVKTRLCDPPPTQAEVAERLLAAFLAAMETEDFAFVADAFDSLPPSTLDALRRAAETGDPQALKAELYRFSALPARHVAEDQSQPPVTKRPPRPKSTGTTP